MNKKSPFRFSALVGIAMTAACVGWPNVSRSEEASSTKASGEPRGHQMRRYQAFARQAELPQLTVASDTTLRVGTEPKLDCSRLAQVPPAQCDALAAQFAVPAPVMSAVLRRLSATPAPAASLVARELKTAVIDYRFLHGEWSRYRPPQQGQESKTQALQSLEAGDIAKAWNLYDNLGIPPAPAVAPPQPPANLRVAASQ